MLYLIGLLFYTGTTALNVTYSPAEFPTFRTEEVRTLTVNVTEYDSQLQISGRKKVVVKCLNEFICEATPRPEEVDFQANGLNNSFDIEVKALFLGVTELNITVGDVNLPPYPLRLLRSAKKHRITQAFTVFIAVFVFIISFMMGTQLELKRIYGIVKAPIGPIIGFFCQSGLMPVLGFILAEYGLPDDNLSIKLALFAVSTCPGGGKSSFWTIIFGGNLDLSISMTFSQTVAALFMMPLWMSTVGHHFTDNNIQIPFARILEGLVGLMIPTSLGMLYTHYKPEHIKIVEKWIKRVSWVAMFFVSAFAIYSNYYIIWIINWPIVLCGCAQPWLGYIIAFIVANLCRQAMKDCVTIAIETGIQNIGIAMLLMMWCLPEPESDISVTIVFVIAIMTDKPLVVIWLITRGYKKWCKKDQVNQVDTDAEKQIPKLETDELAKTSKPDKKKEDKKSVKGNKKKVYELDESRTDNELKE